MNEKFFNAPLSEKAKLAFITIPINEYATIHLSLPKDDKSVVDFYMDFVNTLMAKDPLNKNSKGAVFATNLMARAFCHRDKQSKGGKKGMANRYSKKGEKIKTQ